MIVHLFQIAGSNTIVSLVLAALATLAGVAGRRPALTSGLWMLVLVKLLTPAIVPLPIGPALGGAPIPARTIATGRGAPDSPADRSATASAPAGSPSSESSLFTTSGPMPEHRDVRGMLTFVTAGIWLAGSLTCATIAAVRIRRFSRLLAHATPASAGFQLESDRAARKLRLRQPPAAWMLPGPITPMLWAPLFLPRILLPGDLWETLTFEQRETLLLHELAHLKRWDHRSRWVELIATIAYWWNPLVWWARAQMRQAEEECCDAWVTRARPGARDDYSAALVEVIDFTSVKSASRVHAPMVPALATGVSRFQQLTRRLQMIDRGTNNCRLGLAGIVLLITAMAALPLALVTRGASLAPASSAPADPLTERRGKSMEKGLAWIAGHLPLPADNAAKHNTAVVSLCGMAFLAAGNDLQQGPYHVQLGQCLDAVLADCHDDGLVAADGSIAAMYQHGYGTLFLAEAFARTHDDRLKPKLERAVTLIEKSQSELGGWRYLPKPMDADVSVTACELNALLACKAAGIAVRPETIQSAVAYVKSCKNDDGGYAYMAGTNSASGPARTAAAAAALQHAGGEPDRVAAAVKYLRPFLEKAGPHQGYADYYASQFLLFAHDAESVEAERKMQERVLSAQAEDGSWDSHDGVGAAYDTACALLSQEAHDGRLWVFGEGK